MLPGTITAGVHQDRTRSRAQHFVRSTRGSGTGPHNTPWRDGRDFLEYIFAVTLVSGGPITKIAIEANDESDGSGTTRVVQEYTPLAEPTAADDLISIEANGEMVNAVSVRDHANDADFPLASQPNLRYFRVAVTVGATAETDIAESHRAVVRTDSDRTGVSMPTPHEIVA